MILDLFKKCNQSWMVFLYHLPCFTHGTIEFWFWTQLFIILFFVWTKYYHITRLIFFSGSYSISFSTLNSQIAFPIFLRNPDNNHLPNVNMVIYSFLFSKLPIKFLELFKINSRPIFKSNLYFVFSKRKRIF